MKLQIHSSLGRRAQQKRLKMENRKKMITEMLFEKYKSFQLSREETATALGISTSSLDRMTKRGQGPKYSQEEGPKNARVTYAIDHIAEYLVNKVVKLTT